jgi:hypoxanthine phosphoribosyltransferase
MDFASFDTQIRKLSHLVLDDTFAPDAIVAISRGGWIPARLLSKYLGVTMLYNYGTVYTDASRTSLAVYQTVKLAPETQRVLVVEDYLITGKSIKHAVGALAAQAEDVRSACLGSLAKAIYAPNYSLGLVTEVPQLPWD